MRGVDEKTDEERRAHFRRVKSTEMVMLKSEELTPPDARVHMSSSSFAHALANGALLHGIKGANSKLQAPAPSSVAQFMRERALPIRAWNEPMRVHTEPVRVALGVEQIR